MSGGERPARVAHEFQRELGAILARGLKDPRITGFITVTGAKMSPDLKEVTVYVSIHGDDATRKSTLAGLRAATGYLQREVSHNIHLRYTPHLHWVYDESVERGDRMERLIKEARAKDAAGHEE
ncbi:MAG TPA: 30S ribosome-binding factor RbfA [Anaeromyxobacteraceae bacterium]|nr:30S ribosome-binding factor RbfA [Anaeromyxobacteraceae bacterium]